MKIRARAASGRAIRGKSFSADRPEETADHLALKLAAFAMFLPGRSGSSIRRPITRRSTVTKFRPDVCVLDDDGGQVKFWIECGEVSINKIDKISRQSLYRRAHHRAESPASNT